MIRAGNMIHVIGDFDDGAHNNVLAVCNQHNVIITTIRSWPLLALRRRWCARAAVLGDWFRADKDRGNAAMIVGKIMHDVLETSLMNHSFKDEVMQNVLDAVISWMISIGWI